MSPVRHSVKAATWRWPAALGADLAGSAAALLRPTCCAALIDGALHGHVVWWTAWALAGAWGLRLLATELRDQWLTDAEDQVEMRLRQSVVAAAGDPASVGLAREVEAFSGMVLRLPVEVVSAILRMMGAAALLACLHPSLLPALVPVVVVVPLVLVGGRRSAAHAAGQHADARLALRRRWAEARRIPALKAWLGPEVVDSHGKEEQAEVRMADATAWIAPLAYGLLTIGVALVLVPGAAAVSAGTLSAGGLTEGVFLVILVLGPLVDLLQGSARWWHLVALTIRFHRLALPRRAALPPTAPWQPWGACVRGSVRIAWSPGRYLDLPDVEVKPGGCLAVRGPSGAGKSTLLRCLAGEEAPVRGEVMVDGYPPRIGPGGVVLLPQGGQCPAPTLRALWSSVGLTPVESDRIAQELGLASVVAGSADQPAGSLPDETRQAGLLIAATATSPRFLLLDEATAALPLASAITALAALRRRGMTLVVVAHRQEELADWSGITLPMGPPARPS